jgi:uncharacterized protein (DUF302 family)
MTYYINKEVDYTFEETIEKVTALLKDQGFGIVTEMNVDKTLKEKIGVDFRRYKILGACNPHFAYQALQMEDKLGTLLPCNVIVQEMESGKVEVAAMNPDSAFETVKNDELKRVAGKVTEILNEVIAGL